MNDSHDRSDHQHDKTDVSDDRDKGYKAEDPEYEPNEKNNEPLLAVKFNKGIVATGEKRHQKQRREGYVGDGCQDLFFYSDVRFHGFKYNIYLYTDKIDLSALDFSAWPCLNTRFTFTNGKEWSMKRTLFIVATVCLIARANGSTAQESVAPRERIAMLGDTNAEFLGKPFSAIAESNNADMVVTPQRSSTVADWNEHEEWIAWLDEFDPTIVIIVLGTNEAALARKNDELTRSFQSLFERLTNDSRRVVWAKPIANAKMKNLEPVCAAIESSGAIWIDSNETIERAGAISKRHEFELWAEDIAKQIGL